MADVTPEQIRKGKEEAIKKIADADVDTTRLTDEELDKLLGKLVIQEKLTDVVECLENVGGSKQDIYEAIPTHLGYKLEEAKDIYNDILQERKTNNRLDKILEALA